MARVSITNGTWFDPSKAKSFEEATRWNGSNHISVATGSQWDHEQLYFTRKGTWVLHSWSQWQGSSKSYMAIDATVAAQWLVTNGHDIPAALVPVVAAQEA